jgi:cell wall-associated NlpC family hydrolase
LGEELKAALEAEEEARREAERREAERRAAEEAAREAEEAERRAAEQREAEQAAEQQPETHAPAAMDADEQEKRKILVDAAYSQLGLPYVWGGKEPGVGMDCSGLVSWCYDQIGIHMPHYHASIGEYVREYRSVEELEPGDVVLWCEPIGTHVAMYIGNNQIIEEIYRGCSINNIYDRMPYSFAGSIL